MAVAVMPGTWVWALSGQVQQSMAPTCLSNFGTLQVGDLVRGEAGNQEEKRKAGRKKKRRKGGKRGGWGP